MRRKLGVAKTWSVEEEEGLALKHGKRKKTCGYMKIVEVSSSIANTIPKLIHRIIGASVLKSSTNDFYVSTTSLLPIHLWGSSWYRNLQDRAFFWVWRSICVHPYITLLRFGHINFKHCFLYPYYLLTPCVTSLAYV